MIKVFKQHDAKDCGAACLAMITHYYGVNISLSKARELLHIDNNGCSVFAMVSVANSVGIKAEAECLDESSDAHEELKKLKNLGPCVANIVTVDGFSHFVVVEKITQKIYLIDPAKGRLKISLCDFLKLWTGVIITFSVDDTHQIHEKNDNYLCALFKKLYIDNLSSIRTIAIFSLLSSIMAVLQVFLVQGIFNNAFMGEVHHHHSFISQARGISNRFLNILTWNKYIYREFILVCVFKVVFKMGYEFKKNNLACEVDAKMFELLFNKTTKLPYSFFETRRTGEIVTRFEEIYKIRNSFVGIVKNVFCDALIILLLNLIILFKYKEMIVVEVFVLIIYGVLLCIENKTLNNSIYEALMKKEILFSHLTKCYSTILDFVYGDNGFNKKELYKKQCEATRNLKNTSNLTAMFDSIEAAITEVCPALICTCGQLLIINRRCMASDYFVCFFLLIILLGYFRSFCTIVINIMTFSNSAERLGDILEAEEKPEYISSKNMKNKLIVFDNVSFSYGFSKLILRNISFEIKRGDTVAFVGASGSGKTTIIKVIMNYSNDFKGKISRGTDKIACINQESCIYNESIRRNILLDKNITEEWFENICRITRVDKIASLKSKGYETIMDEKGTDFSMGEKQRIIFARVLLDNPELLIIDEAGNSIDSANEVEIIQDIRNAYKEMAIVVITHRMPIVKMCDRIYLLEDGTISNYGTHDELKIQSKEYNKLCSAYAC